MPKILIIDDVQEYLDSLSRALTSEYEVRTVAGLQAAKDAVNDSIHLALVDIRLSENDPYNRDGIEFLKWLKQNWPSIPVVMMSAYTDFDAAVDALNLGATRYLKKPINLRELKDLIRSLLKDVG